MVELENVTTEGFVVNQVAERLRIPLEKFVGAEPQESWIAHPVTIAGTRRVMGACRLCHRMFIFPFAPEGVLSQTFMTVCPADLSKPGRVVFSIAGHPSVLLEYDGKVWDVAEEQMSTSQPDEKRVADNWGHRPIWRLLLTNKTQDKKGTFFYKIKQL